MAEKWNFKTHEYEPYKLPSGARMCCDRENEIIPCAGCGREITFAKSYVSLSIHNWAGLGYLICGDCFKKEDRERRIYGKKIDG